MYLASPENCVAVMPGNHPVVPMNRNIRVRFVSDSLLMIQANLIRRIKEPMAMASPTTS